MASAKLREARRQQQVPTNVVLFDNVDVCITGYGYHQLFLLPIRNIRTITCHEWHCLNIVRWGFPTAWKSFRVFDNNFRLRNFEEKSLRERWKLLGVKNLQWKGPELQPKLQMCLLDDSAVPPIMEEMETMTGRNDWSPSACGFQFELYPRQEPHGNCRPCDLCGEYSPERLLKLTPQGTLGSPDAAGAVGERRTSIICNLAVDMDGDD
jgi:hypothetical protein